MASIKKYNGINFRIRWRLGGSRTGTWQSATFSDEALALKVKSAIEKSGHELTSAQVYAMGAVNQEFDELLTQLLAEMAKRGHADLNPDWVARWLHLETSPEEPNVLDIKDVASYLKHFPVPVAAGRLEKDIRWHAVWRARDEAALHDALTVVLKTDFEYRERVARDETARIEMLRRVARRTAHNLGYTVSTHLTHFDDETRVSVYITGGFTDEDKASRKEHMREVLEGMDRTFGH